MPSGCCPKLQSGRLCRYLLRQPIAKSKQQLHFVGSSKETERSRHDDKNCENYEKIAKKFAHEFDDLMLTLVNFGSIAKRLCRNLYRKKLLKHFNFKKLPGGYMSQILCTKPKNFKGVCNLCQHNNLNNLVPGTGVEPAHPCGYKVLNLACLPVSPPRHAEL
jgi:hypothetical protein